MTDETPLAALPGWEPLAQTIPPGSTRSFVQGDPERIDIAYYRRVDDGAVVARVRLGPGAEGPPGHAHGGSIMAILDDAATS